SWRARRSPVASLPARSAIGLDLLSCRREHVPAGAEVVQALALGLARLRVQGEPVERMARVGDLLAAVCPPGRSEQRLLQAGTSDGFPVGEQRRPERRALSVAGAASVLVLLEQIERATLAVDD